MLRGRLLLQHIYGLTKGSSLTFLSFQRAINVTAMDGKYEKEEDSFYSDIPRSRKKWERKPYQTPVKVLIRRAKEEKKIIRKNPCRALEHPPENGLLVPHLVEVAKEVYIARESMLLCLTKLLDSDDTIAIKKCRFCSEVHIGHVGHEIRTCEGPNSASRQSAHVWKQGGIRDVVCFPYCYHLYDRVVKPRVGHKERFDVQKLPAIVELCIQAGLDLAEFPTKRRTNAVYSIEGRIVDLVPENDDDSVIGGYHEMFSSVTLGLDLRPLHGTTTNELASMILHYWFKMRSGTVKIMKRYNVITCGYCYAVQVGPKGHKVRMCKATKHQSRKGLHAWQEATIDDLIRPNYVWHVRDPHGAPLANELRRYYGKAPAIVEVCVRAGAPIPIEYRSMMRSDVVRPDRDEYDLVA